MEITIPQCLLHNFNKLAEPWRSGTKEFMAYILGKEQNGKLQATPFWVHFGPRSEKQLKHETKFKTLSHTILIPILEAFWIHFRVHGSIWGSILGSRSASGPLLESFWNHLRSMDPFWGPCRGPFWAPGAPLGSRPHVRTDCGANLEPFWDPIWIPKAA